MRERRPVAAAGIAVPPLSGLTEHAMERVGRTDFGVLVERFRSPWVVPFGVPGVEQVWNTLEFFVHHEDIRRAQAGWAPRSLPESDEQTPVVLPQDHRPRARPARRRTPADGVGGRTATLRGGDDPVVLRGAPSEIALVLQGRARVADLTYDGPAEAVARLRGADLGV